MSYASRKRAELVRARSGYAATQPKPSTKVSTGGGWEPNPTLFYVAGLALALPSVGAMVWFYVLGLGGAPIEEDYGLAPPLVLFFSGIPLFFAEMFRRARWESRATRGSMESGSVAITMQKTRLWAVLLWLLLPLAAHVLFIPLRVLAETSGGAFGSTVRGASDGFWEMVEVYGIFTAGVLGVMLASLLKRATYERLASRYGPPGARGRGFWGGVSTQWRGEMWLSFASGCAFAEIPMIWHRAVQWGNFDHGLLLFLTAFAVTLGVLCVGLTLNAWRSGVSYGVAESI